MSERIEDIKVFLKETYGVTATTVERLKEGFVNEGYFVEATEGKYILRISGEKPKEEVQFEVDVLLELEKSDVPSPSLVATKDGTYLTEFDCRPTILYNYLPGSVAEKLTTEQLYEVGRHIGEKHQYLAGFEPSVTKETWEPNQLVVLYKEGRDALLAVGTDEAKAVVAFCDEHLCDVFELPKLPQGVTHQDVKRENIVVDAERVSGIIDFDNAYVGTLLYDLLTAIMWEGYEGDRLEKERVAAILEGYQSKRPLTDEERQHIAEGYRLRIIREVFIGPHAALRDKDKAAVRAMHFIARYNALSDEDKALLAALTS